MKLVLLGLAGAAAGYLYHRVVGCSTGACPMTANPWLMTFLGAAVAVTAAAGR